MSRYVSSNPTSDEALANIDPSRVSCVQARRVIVKVRHAFWLLSLARLWPPQLGAMDRCELLGYQSHVQRAFMIHRGC